MALTVELTTPVTGPYQQPIGLYVTFYLPRISMPSPC